MFTATKTDIETQVESWFLKQKPREDTLVNTERNLIHLTKICMFFCPSPKSLQVLVEEIGEPPIFHSSIGTSSQFIIAFIDPKIIPEGYLVWGNTLKISWLGDPGIAPHELLQRELQNEVIRCIRWIERTILETFMDSNLYKSKTIIGESNNA